MPSATSMEITQFLLAWNEGDQNALARLVPLIYSELHRLAKHYIEQERPGHLLQPTALVNEAYLRLIDCRNVSWQNRAHFLGISAKLMRRILVDFARSRNCGKRGGAVHPVSLEEAAVVAEERDADFVALDDALTSLAAIDPRKSKIVELRFFGGLSVEETAEVLAISTRTVKREWSLAQAWLHRELSKGESP